MSNDLSVNMRRSRLDAEHAAERRRYLISAAASLREKHEKELLDFITSRVPEGATALADTLVASYRFQPQSIQK